MDHFLFIVKKRYLLLVVTSSHDKAVTIARKHGEYKELPYQPVAFAKNCDEIIAVCGSGDGVKEFPLPVLPVAWDNGCSSGWLGDK